MQRGCRLLAMAVVFMMASFFPVSRAWSQAAPRRVEITARQFAFAPGEITLKKGQPTVLVLKSNDVAHGLRIRELNIAIKVEAHGTAEAQITPQKTGDFTGHCYVFCGKGHGSMVLTIHVVD